jgi:hypothetical protein
LVIKFILNLGFIAGPIILPLAPLFLVAVQAFELTKYCFNHHELTPAVLAIISLGGIVVLAIEVGLALILSA